MFFVSNNMCKHEKYSNLAYDSAAGNSSDSCHLSSGNDNSSHSFLIGEVTSGLRFKVRIRITIMARVSV
eukprot:1318780-Amorphochlora_amoeboformis.AAC.1